MIYSSIKQATLYNYADDNTLACFSGSSPEVDKVLEEEAGNILSWLDQNEMTANPNKFHALFVKKKIRQILVPGESEKTWGVWRTVTSHLATQWL